MLFSPKSELSSFRDYYQNSSDRQLSDLGREDKISVGYRNFKVSKIFSRLRWKIKEKQYWILFDAFKKLAFRKSTSDLSIVRQIKLSNILSNLVKKQSKVNIKRWSLERWCENMNTQRSGEIILQRSLVLFYIKKYYQRLSLSYKIICFANIQEEVKVDKGKVRIVKKLCKALLCILFRNRMHLKLKSGFQALKQICLVNSSRRESSITFFKQKKERKVYEQRVDDRINQLSYCISIYNWIFKRVNIRMNNCWLKLRIMSRKQNKETKMQKKEQNKDSLEVMTSVVKHMVYLTGKFSTKSSEKEEILRVQERDLKFKRILLQLKIKERQIMRSSFSALKRVALLQNLQIQRQIHRLQAIKKYYVQQS